MAARGKPVHEDVAVAGERLPAEEAGLEKVAVRRRIRRRLQPSCSSPSSRAHELVLHAGADQPGPRRRRQTAPAERERVVPAAASATGPARAAEGGGVHRRRRRGSLGRIHLRGFSHLDRSGPSQGWFGSSRVRVRAATVRGEAKERDGAFKEETGGGGGFYEASRGGGSRRAPRGGVG